MPNTIDITIESSADTSKLDECLRPIYDILGIKGKYTPIIQVHDTSCWAIPVMISPETIGAYLRQIGEHLLSLEDSGEIRSSEWTFTANNQGTISELILSDITTGVFTGQ